MCKPFDADLVIFGGGFVTHSAHIEHWTDSTTCFVRAHIVGQNWRSIGLLCRGGSEQDLHALSHVGK